MAAELDDRFVSSLRNLGIGIDSSCVVALSGGGDSVALLELMAKSKHTLNCSAARVTHGIRDLESEETENSFCEELCADRNIPFSILYAEDGIVYDIKKRFGCGIEQAAREIRHRLLKEHMRARKAQYVFYGHTADDNLETIFMRLILGSGAEGLGGIAMLRKEAVRPLLEFERRELREYLLFNGIDWMEDPSNSSKIYRRNRIRNELLPLLSDIFPGWSKTLGVLGEKSQEAALALRRLSSKELSPTVERDSYSWKEGDWDSASDYSKALVLWDAFNKLDDSGIPDRRISWRTLKAARAAIDARRAWNSYNLKLARGNGFIVMSKADFKDALRDTGGRIILGRSEVEAGFAADIGPYHISVSLQRAAHPGVLVFSIGNWPLEIRFGSYGMKVNPLLGNKTKMLLPREKTDCEEEIVYILIRED